jgi:hypothetical protein
LLCRVWAVPADSADRGVHGDRGGPCSLAPPFAAPFALCPLCILSLHNAPTDLLCRRVCARRRGGELMDGAGE